MSVFRNTPRPGDKEGEPSRYSENILSRPLASDLASDDQQEPDHGPAPSFLDREREAPRPTSAPTPAEKCTNVIAAGSRWNGSLNLDESVRIEGQCSGEIVAKGTVHISEGARVEAKITAGFVVISGSFKGQIRCEERLELLPKSRVEGDLVTKTLNVHEGAIIDGTIAMGAPKPAPAERTRATATADQNEAARAAKV